MKLKNIAAYLAILSGICLFPVCANAAEVIVENNSAAAGSTVNVAFKIKPSGSESESLNGFAVAVTYDSDILTPVVQGETDETGGALYAASDIDSGIIVAKSLESSDTGKLGISWAGSEALSVSDETSLFTISFDVADDVNVDSTDIGISVIAYAEDSETLEDTDEISISTGTVSFDVTVEILRGDADGSGTVDIADAALISRYLASLTVIDDDNLENADADGSGTVDIADAALISRYLASIATID